MRQRIFTMACVLFFVTVGSLASAQKKMTLHITGLVAVVEDGDDVWLVLPDARRPRDAQDETPIPAHSPMMFVTTGKGLQARLLGKYDVTIKLGANGPSATTVQSTVKQRTADMAQLAPEGSLPGNFLNAPQRAVAARLRLPPGTLKVSTLPRNSVSGRTKFFGLATGAGPGNVAVEKAALALEFETQAASFTIEFRRFGNSTPNDNLTIKSDDGNLTATLGNFAAQATSNVVDKHFEWFYRFYEGPLPGSTEFYVPHIVDGTGPPAGGHPYCMFAYFKR